MTAADVPSVVKYGKVIGHFVSYLADSADAGEVPDEKPLGGSVTLTPLTVITRWPTTTPPRIAIAQKVVCRVIQGDLCPPDSNVPGITVVATDQPDGEPSTIQWKATYALTDVSTQPNDITFNVPANGVVDLALITSIPPEPPTVVVVSHEDALAAAASADEAELAQQMAFAAADDAQSLVNSAPKWWTGTLADFNALPTKDPLTLYILTP